MNMRLFSRLDHLFYTGIWSPDLQIFKYSSLEKHRFLQYHTHIAAQHRQWIHAIINAIYFNTSLRNFVEPWDQFTSVVLPPPESPTSATFFPEAICRLTPL